MSHIASVAIVVRDLDALASACEERGLEFRRDVREFIAYGGSRNKCDHMICAVGNPDAYQVGVVRGRVDATTGEAVVDPAGDAWVLRYDDYSGGRGMTALTGRSCGGLLQSYGIKVAEKQARQQGFAVARETLADGTVRLTLTPPAIKQTAVVRGW